MTKTILVIDEEKISFKGIKYTIENRIKDFDYSFEYVRTASDGLQKIFSFNYDLIVLDMMLPKGTMEVKHEREDLCYGIDALEAIFKIKPSEKIICFTNVRDNDIIREIERLGGIYICKLGRDSNKLFSDYVLNLLKS